MAARLAVAATVAILLPAAAGAQDRPTAPEPSPTLPALPAYEAGERTRPDMRGNAAERARARGNGRERAGDAGATRPGAFGTEPTRLPGAFNRSPTVGTRAADVELDLSERAKVGLFGEVDRHLREDVRTRTIREGRELGAGMTFQYRFGSGGER